MILALVAAVRNIKIAVTNDTLKTPVLPMIEAFENSCKVKGKGAHMNYGDYTFDDVSDWAPIFQRIDQVFFYGEASYGWKKLLYGLAVELRFPPELYYELYAEAYHLHLMQSVKEVARLAERWRILGFQSLDEARLFQHKRMLNEPIFAYVKRELKIDFFPYDEKEKSIITWNEVFKFDIQLISFAIARLNQSLLPWIN